MCAGGIYLWQLFGKVLPTICHLDSEHVLWLNILALSPVFHFGQIHLLRLLYPCLEKLADVLLISHTTKIWDAINDGCQLHEHHLLLVSVTLINEGHMIAATAILWHATNGSDHISQHHTLVLSRTGDTNCDVAQVCGELRIISSEVRVWSEHSWTKHDSFDTETDQQDIAKEPHRRSLVLLIAHIADQRSLVDVAILRRFISDLYIIIYLYIYIHIYLTFRFF